MDVGADAGAAFHSDGIKPYYDGKIQSLKVRSPHAARIRSAACARACAALYRLTVALRPHAPGPALTVALRRGMNRWSSLTKSKT